MRNSCTVAVLTTLGIRQESIQVEKMLAESEVERSLKSGKISFSLSLDEEDTLAHFCAVANQPTEPTDALSRWRSETREL